MNKNQFGLLLSCLSLVCTVFSTQAFSQSSSIDQASQQRLNQILESRPQQDYSESFKRGQEILNSRFSNWGIDPNTHSSINISELWKNFNPNRQVVVAVVDTGIDPEHPFLKDNIYVPNGQASSTNFGLDFSKNAGQKFRPYDSHGHGTHVAGIIKSVFPDVKLLTLKYYNPSASGQDNLNSTIAALRYAVEQNVDIINYSGGGPEPSKQELEVLKEAERKGILVIAAAGNEESNIDNPTNAYYPASYGLSNIITVGAHDQALQMLTSSNFGKNTVHLTAPGHRIKSSLHNNRTGYLTGTSQATAFVSGVAALLMSQYSDLTPGQVRDVIIQSVRKESHFTNRVSSGGRLDAANAQRLAAAVVQEKEQGQGQTFRRDVATQRTPNNVGQIIFLKEGKQKAETEKTEESKSQTEELKQELRAAN